MLESIITPDDFNTHFLYLFTPIAENHYWSTLPVSESSLDPLPFCDIKCACVPPFELHEATDSEVTTCIELMDPKKAKGEDGIPVQFLRLVHLVR